MNLCKLIHYTKYESTNHYQMLKSVQSNQKCILFICRISIISSLLNKNKSRNSKFQSDKTHYLVLFQCFGLQQGNLVKLCIIFISNLVSKNHQMGATQSQTFHNTTFKQQQWQSIPVSSYTKLKDPYYGSNFKVLLNKLNRTIEVEKYDLVFNSESQYKTYKELIDWRSTNRYLVSAKYIQNTKENGLCSNFYQASVFFQRKPVRLYQIQDVPLQEGLYILYAAAQGFQKLYDKYGYFEIDSEMICFTKEGLVKVWVNKNLSKSYPENAVIGNKNKNYQVFISKLLTLLQKLIDFENKITISEFINRRRIKNPFDNLLAILQLYVKEANVTIPRYLSSIRNLCNKTKKMKNSKLKDQRTNLNSSYVLSNKSSMSSNEKALQINNLYNISINTPFRRSKQLSYGELTNRKKSSIPPNNKSSFGYKSPNVSFHYSGMPDSPKNHSYTTQQDLFMKSKIYSTVDLSQQNTQKNKEASANFLFENNLEIDPEIAADMLKIANNSL